MSHACLACRTAPQPTADVSLIDPSAGWQCPTGPPGTPHADRRMSTHTLFLSLETPKEPTHAAPSHGSTPVRSAHPPHTHTPTQPATRALVPLLNTHLALGVGEAPAPSGAATQSSKLCLARPAPRRTATPHHYRSNTRNTVAPPLHPV